MKKLFALLLAVLMIAALSVPAFAHMDFARVMVEADDPDVINIKSVTLNGHHPLAISDYRAYIDGFDNIYEDCTLTIEFEIADGYELETPEVQDDGEVQIYNFYFDAQPLDQLDIDFQKYSAAPVSYTTKTITVSFNDLYNGCYNIIRLKARLVNTAKDTINGDFLIAAPAETLKDNTATGSTVAPVIALSSLAVLAAAAVVLSKKSK